MKLVHRVVFCLCIAAPAFAGVGNVSSPEVDKDEFEVEYKARRYGDDSGSSRNNAQSHEVEVKYGFTDDLRAGVSFAAERNPGQGFSPEAYGGEIQYQFTEQEDRGSWLSSAVKAEYGVATDSGEGDEAELKLLLARNQGDFRVIANVELGREVGPDRAPGVELESKIKAYYRGNKRIGPGAEWHAEWGTLDDLTTDGDIAEHYIGPILTGTLVETERDALKYTVGHYWGLTDASADTAQRLQLVYEHRF